MTNLSKEQIKRRVELTNRLKEGIITVEEAEQLKRLLDLEKDTAININDMVALLAISFLMAAVIAFLEEESKKKKKKKSKRFVIF